MNQHLRSEELVLIGVRELKFPGAMTEGQWWASDEKTSLYDEKTSLWLCVFWMLP